VDARVSPGSDLDWTGRWRAAIAGTLSLAGAIGLAASLYLIEAGERGAFASSKSRVDCVFRAGAAREPWARVEAPGCPLDPISYCSAPLI